VAAATGLMAGLPAQAYESPVHVFSINDVMGGFDGSTYGPAGIVQDATILCIPGVTQVSCPVAPIVDKEGVTLYPIDSEFGFDVVDFLGARAKVRNNDYAEGYAGNIRDGDTVVGVKISNAATDTYKVKPPLGTWCQGLGGNSVKCSTEHYVVLEHVQSCHEVVPYQFADPFTGEQQTLGYPDDPDLVNCADNELDNDVRVLTGGVPGDAYDPLLNPMNPNDNTSVLDDIATSSDYSITLKDDGKVLYRWGSLIKRPNDVRLYARLPLPAEWKVPGADFVVNKAELHVTHWITNNPNDQLRPEDLENEAASGRTPDYRVTDVGGDEYWLSTRDCYEGDGDEISAEGPIDPTVLPAETVLRNGQFAYPNLAANPLTQPQELSADLTGGFTNAFYTTINRDPFEWSYRILDGDDNGLIEPADDDYFNHVGFPLPLTDAEMASEGLAFVSGPRWRLKANKFGQDIPGLEIPAEECSPPPFERDNIKYEVGELVTTVINLLDWDALDAGGPSPLATSKGWVDVTANDFVTVVTPEGEPPVTSNGLPMTDDFDLAVYIKGDRKPTAVLNAKLVIDYEEETIENEIVNGSARADVGIGVNAIVGGFVIDGNEQKCVVVRGRGPSLAINLAKLADPTLTLKAAGNTAVIDSSDDWADHPTASNVSALGLAPTDPAEAALYTCLQPGAYTTELRGAPGTDLGLGMFEVFDVDQAASKLVNISARAQVGTGGRRLVSGFVIQGEEPRTVLIRGRGPSLRVNVDKVEDPFVELWSGTGILEFNDDWGDAANAAEISATGKAPSDPAESAILTTLPPGSYTVRMVSATGEPGLGIVEIIDLTEESTQNLIVNFD
jgi:hypothetical protein